ncbi:MAG: hypothetical protein ABW081_00225 [Solirubrobacteraceae bacterium]
MRQGLACAVLAAAMLAAAARPAGAETLCVDPARAECPTAEAAFAAAQDGDRIAIAALEDDAPLASARRIEVVGAGEAATALGPLTLSDPGAAVAELRTTSLDLAGTARQVRVDGRVLLRGSAVLEAAEVDGPVALAGDDAAAALHSVLVRVAGGTALTACDGALVARHVTITGAGDGAAAACAGATLELRDAVVAGTFAEPLDGPVTAASTVLGGSVLVDAAGRLPAGSPLVDTGSAGGLDPSEWPEDRDRVARIADGDGDGVPERDPGAFERQPAATPLPAGNLLRDPGAEAGGAWAFANGFTRERYGTFPFPSAAAGAALGGAGSFFAGGPAATATATQRVEVGGVAPEIDRGTATVTLSGLLGGFRADADAGALEATFRDPAGAAIRTVALAAPTAAQRANVTTLQPRARTDAVPRLTRAIDVTMRATRAGAGEYDDAYFDNVALTFVAPGAPPPPPPDDPPLKPFAGVRAITGLATVDRARRRIGVRLLCLDATVGRCRAVLTLTTRLKARGPFVTAGTAEAAVRPGAIRRVHIGLNGKARRTVRERRRVKMLLYASARDGQGVTRLSTIPLRVQWPRKPRTPTKRPR